MEDRLILQTDAPIAGVRGGYGAPLELTILRGGELVCAELDAVQAARILADLAQALHWQLRR